MRRFIGFMVLLCVFTLSSCEILPPVGGEDPVVSENVVDSVITGNVTWVPGDRYHVTKSVTVTGTLTIQPGTVVVLDENLTVSGSGTLNAVGTSAEPISFSAAGTEWGSMTFDAGSTVNLSYCDISKGGRFTSVINSNGASSITYCTIHDNFGGGVNASAASGGTTTITHNAFYANGGYPAVMNELCVVDNTNQFHKTGSTAFTDYNCVEFDGNINSDVAFNITEVPYYIYHDSFAVGNFASGSTLTIAPGAAIKFSDGNWAGMLVKSGSSVSAVGTSANPITFTVSSNDGIKGDTDGSPASPGLWAKISVETGASLTMTYCALSYAGAGVGYAVDVTGTANFTNCAFEHNCVGAVYAVAGSTATITYCTAQYNGVDGIGSFDYYRCIGSTMILSGTNVGVYGEETT